MQTSRGVQVLHEGAGPLGDAVRAIFEVLSFHLYLVFEPLFEHFLVLAQQQVLRQQLNRPLQRTEDNR